MTATQTSFLLRYLHHLAVCGSIKDVPDGPLLERTEGVLFAEVVGSTKGALQMTAKAKFKLMAFLLLSVSAATGGIGLFAPRTPAEQQVPKNEPQPAPVVAKAEVKRLEQEVYSVFDLVVDLRSSPDQPTVEDKLIRLIVDVTAPRTWADRGGRGTIDYFLPAKSLVVNQTADVQDQIADLLRLLRRLANAERGGVFVTTLIESNEGRDFLRRYLQVAREKKQATRK